VAGGVFGGACPQTNWQWRQCVFAGWVLLLLASLAILVALLVVLLCCCCCCRCRRRRREAQEARRYKDLEKQKVTSSPRCTWLSNPRQR
jgi:heme/copper-type cytochrome/quinol oxidase subunit 2